MNHVNMKGIALQEGEQKCKSPELVKEMQGGQCG